MFVIKQQEEIGMIDRRISQDIILRVAAILLGTWLAPLTEMVRSGQIEASERRWRRVSLATIGEIRSATVSLDDWLRAEQALNRRRLQYRVANRRRQSNVTVTRKYSRTHGVTNPASRASACTCCATYRCLGYPMAG